LSPRPCDDRGAREDLADRLDEERSERLGIQGSETMLPVMLVASDPEIGVRALADQSEYERALAPKTITGRQHPV